METDSGGGLPLPRIPERFNRETTHLNSFASSKFAKAAISFENQARVQPTPLEHSPRWRARIDNGSPGNSPLLAGKGGRETTFFGLADRPLPVSGYGQCCRSDTVGPKLQKCSNWSSPFFSLSPMANLKSLHIPRPIIDFSPTGAAEPTTPKTPADEGIEFFEFASVDNKAPIRVYELQLDPDGGPNKDRTVWFLLISRKSFLTSLSFHLVRAIASGYHTLCPTRHHRRRNTRLQERCFQNQFPAGWRSLLSGWVYGTQVSALPICPSGTTRRSPSR